MFDLTALQPLDTPEGLRHAVLHSLFTDRDDWPATTHPRPAGWWAEPVPTLNAPGSRLWRYARSKRLPDTPERLRRDLQAALQWLIDAGHLTHIDIHIRPGPTPGRLDGTLRLHLPHADPLEITL